MPEAGITVTFSTCTKPLEDVFDGVEKEKKRFMRAAARYADSLAAQMIGLTCKPIHLPVVVDEPGETPCN